MAFPGRSLAARAKGAVFEGIRRYHRALPPFLDLYAGGRRKIGPVFPKEAEMLFALTRMLMPETVLEIGVGLAGSTITLAEALRLNGRGRLVGLDLSQGSIARTRRLLRYHGLDSLADFVLGDSHSPDTRDHLRQMLGQVDILFIDGDHTFEGCRMDFEMYEPLLRPSGIIVFHDSGVFSPTERALLDLVSMMTEADELPLNADRTGVYHSPGVPEAIDWILANRPDYSVLSLQTLAEPCCGIAILQKKGPLFRPSADGAVTAATAGHS